MKITESQTANLTNSEVLAHIRRVRSRYSQHPDFKRHSSLKHLNIVTQDTEDYLAAQRSSYTLVSQQTDDKELIPEFVRRVMPYGLTKSEAIMILNLRPRDQDLLAALVEEADLVYDDEEGAESPQEGEVRGAEEDEARPGKRFTVELWEGLVGVVAEVLGWEQEEMEGVEEGQEPEQGA